MPYLVVALVLVSLVATANLLFTYGVIRRLNEHSARLGALATSAESGLILAAGAAPGAFDGAVTTGGEPVTPASFEGGALIGFFSPSCPPCREQAPRFAARAAVVGKDNTTAVVVGEPAAAREMVDRFEPVARVVVEDEDGPLQRAFQVRGFPAMCLLDADGRVKGSGSTVDGLPDPPVM